MIRGKKYEKVSNYAHFQFSNRAFNEITAQPCVIQHGKSFHARVFRSLAFAGNVSDFVPPDVLQELLITLCRALRHRGSIVRSVRRSWRRKRRRREGRKEEGRRRKRKANGVGGVEEERSRGEANLNLEPESE